MRKSKVAQARGGAIPEGAQHDNGAVTYRQLAGDAEFAACVELQRRTWGSSYQEVVPASMLKVTQRVGGVVAGAFGNGELCGFVYGVTGVSAEQRLVHWSHMLAVHPEYRNRGIGRRLKRHQRGLLRPLGVSELQWTFDPLVARNAHLNLHHLGADIVEYVPDMYGATGSDLHTFGTDRFVVRWPVEPGAPSRPPIAAEDAEAPVLNEATSAVPSSPPLSTLRARLATGRVVRVEIPADVEAMRHGLLDLARAWRASSRAALLAAFEGGFRVTGFVRSADGRCYYVLRRGGGV